MGDRVHRLDDVLEHDRDPWYEPLTRSWSDSLEAEPDRGSGLLLIFVMLLAAAALAGAVYLLW